MTILRNISFPSPVARALSTQLSTAALDKHPQSAERGITLDLVCASCLPTTLEPPPPTEALVLHQKKYAAVKWLGELPVTDRPRLIIYPLHPPCEGVLVIHSSAASTLGAFPPERPHLLCLGLLRCYSPMVCPSCLPHACSSVKQASMDAESGPFPRASAAFRSAGRAAV